MLIHGKEGLGASLFTITAVADLYSKGKKVLFLNGYHMARDEFKSQVGDAENSVVVDSPDELNAVHKYNVIFMKRETPGLFVKAI